MALTKKALEFHSSNPPRRAMRLWDGSGLYAAVSPKGVIRFAMKYREGGKERRKGFGRWPALSLEEARRLARTARVKLDRGERIPRGKRAESIGTFKDAVREWTAVNESRLTERTMVQVRRYLGACTEGFGTMPLQEVKPTDVLAVLRKFENRKAFESAKRARIYASAVFDFAIALGLAETNPAAPLKARGVLRQRPIALHHASMPAEQIPDFLRKLRAGNLHPSIRAALEFLVLTALRTGEVLELRWADIAADGKSLTIPAERMKGRRPHTVQLSKQARAVLDEIRPFSAGRVHVFPGRDPDGPLSNMAFLMCLRRMKANGTVHGFRASFSTWAHAKGAQPHVVERCLAHASADKVAAAYNRHAYDAEAARLWQKWADAIIAGADSAKERRRAS